jgi:hypothetical protein
MDLNVSEKLIQKMQLVAKREKETLLNEITGRAS